MIPIQPVHRAFCLLRKQGAKNERCPMKSRISGTAGPRTYFLCSILTRRKQMLPAFLFSKRLKIWGWGFGTVLGFA